jgi:hypothetical protein
MEKPWKYLKTLLPHNSCYQALYTIGRGRKLRRRDCEVILLKARLKQEQKIVISEVYTGDRKKRDGTIVQRNNSKLCTSPISFVNQRWLFEGK